MYREYETERKLMMHRQYINQETIDSGLQISYFKYSKTISKCNQMIGKTREEKF